ncbi:hypothetical protein BH23VER1_BH23VER1_06610 [soil metagenome]
MSHSNAILSPDIEERPRLGGLRGKRYSLAHPQWVLPDQLEATDAQGMVYGRIAEYVLMASFVVCLAVYEWIRWVLDQPPHPAVLTMFAGLMVVYAGVRIGFLWPKLKAIRAVAEGHRELRKEIEDLGGRGYYFFEPPRRDKSRVPSGGVLVGSNGVFALTVRSYTRGENPYEKICHKRDGSLTVSGHEAMASPLEGSRQIAEWVGSLLETSTGTRYPVVPILACPGWRIAKPGEEVGRDVMVVNEVTFAETIMRRESGHRLEANGLIAVCEALEEAFGAAR